MNAAGGSEYSNSESATTLESPSIVTTSLPDGRVGDSYSTTLEASGGETPYTWSVVGGGLPPGLGISSGGVISGTPTALGNYSVDVQVTDSNGLSGTRSFTIEITSNISEFVALANADATISNFRRNRNFGTYDPDDIVTENLVAGVAGSVWTVDGPSDEKFRALARFDLSGVPSDAEILSATMIFRLRGGHQAQTSNPRGFELRRVTSNWTEAGVTWNNQPGVGERIAGWNYLDCATCEFDVLDLVSQWVNGSRPNQGVMILAPDAATFPEYSMGFYTRSDPSPSNVPRIIIEYRR